MKLLGSNDENNESGGSNRPQIRTSQDDAVGYGGFHPQENEFPAAFVPKRWAGTDDIVEVNKKLLLIICVCYTNQTIYETIPYFFFSLSLFAVYFNFTLV